MIEKLDFHKKDYSEEELIEIAKKRIKVKRQLYSHITAYIIVNTFLMFLYLFNNDFSFEGYPWFLWPLAGWGVGLLFHIVETVQELNFKYNANAINKELEKIKKHIKTE